jgi:transcriptional regulator with XRE-family HTH domain
MVNITRIKDLREDSDIRQKELADALGISQSAYSHYENGTRKIPLDILMHWLNIMAALQIICGAGQRKRSLISLSANHRKSMEIFSDRHAFSS